MQYKLHFVSCLLNLFLYFYSLNIEFYYLKLNKLYYDYMG
jgi:hypothetical protein